MSAPIGHPSRFHFGDLVAEIQCIATQMNERGGHRSSITFELSDPEQPKTSPLLRSLHEKFTKAWEDRFLKHIPSRLKFQVEFDGQSWDGEGTIYATSPRQMDYAFRAKALIEDSDKSIKVEFRDWIMVPKL